MSMPRPSANSAIIERKAAPFIIPPEVPPKFVEKLLHTSKALGGVGFALRGNTSQPRYKAPGAPKPFYCKGKISNNGPAQGYLVVDSHTLGRIEKDGHIKAYGENDIPKDAKGNVVLPQMQGQQTLQFFMEGLNRTPPLFKLVDGEVAADGKLRIQTISGHKHVEATIFSIDLMGASIPPVANVKPEDISSAAELKLSQPSWWQPQFGEWEKQSVNNYPVFYQTPSDSKPKPMMVYALLDQHHQPIPIVSDQDLLWITLPKELSNQLPADAKQVINASKIDPDGRPSGMIAMMTALVKVGHDLEKITGIPPLFKDEDDVPDKVAGYGCMTPLEAYIAIMVNNDFGMDVAHVRDLIQHGAENRNPYAPSDLNGAINHVGIDIKGRDFVLQTKNEQQLVNFVLNTRGFLENNVFDVHKGWDMSLWAPVIERQKAIKDYPIPHETLEAYDRYKTTHSFQPIHVDVVLKSKKHGDSPTLTEKNWHDLEKLCKEKGWQLKKYDDNTGIIKLSDNTAISVKENGLDARESSKEVVHSMAKVFQVIFPEQNYSIRTQDADAKATLARQLETGEGPYISRTLR